MVRGELFAGGTGQSFNLLLHHGVEVPQEVLGQHGHVRAALAQGRRAELHDVQAVEQILAELVLADGSNDVAIGRGDEPHVDPQLGVAPHAGEGAVFQKPQQLGLERAAHVANLVQKNGAAVRLLDAARFLFDRTGEGALLVTEQLALQQRLGNGGAVDPDVGGLAAFTQGVQRAGDQFLARAALAEDEHRGMGGRDGLNQLAQFTHLGRVADDVVQMERVAGAGAQDGVLLEQPVPLGAPGHGVQQFFRLAGLGQVVEGTGLDRLSGELGRGKGGDHQHRQMGPALVAAAQKFPAVHAPEAEVRDDHEEFFPLDQPQRLLRRGDILHGIALLTENRPQRKPHVVLVIHYQQWGQGCVHCRIFMKVRVGNSRMKRVPRPSSDSTRTRPA